MFWGFKSIQKTYMSPWVRQTAMIGTLLVGPRLGISLAALQLGPDVPEPWEDPKNRIHFRAPIMIV